MGDVLRIDRIETSKRLSISYRELSRVIARGHLVRLPNTGRKAFFDPEEVAAYAKGGPAASRYVRVMRVPLGQRTKSGLKPV